MKTVFLLLIIFTATLSGCIQIRSTQLQALKKAITGDDTSLLPYEWHIEWGDYKKNAYAVNLNPVYVFGNVYGDGITLENMLLREAEGLGKYNNLWQFIERDGHLMAYVSGKLKATYTCGAWRMAREEPNRKLNQTCIDSSGTAAVNSIVLNPAGEVITLTYSVLKGEPSLVLTKVAK